MATEPPAIRGPTDFIVGTAFDRPRVGAKSDAVSPPGVTQASPQSSRIAIDSRSSGFPKDPELEALDDGCSDAAEREIAHRLKFRSFS